MGDRANFGFKDGDNTVYLYAHWGGYQMLDRLAQALQCVVNENRLGDPSYATRIAISNIIGNDWSKGTGYGITVNELADNEHSVPVVDWEKGTVSLHDWGWMPDNGLYITWENPKFVMSIPIFIQKFLKTPVEKPLTYTRV